MQKSRNKKFIALLLTFSMLLSILSVCSPLLLSVNAADATTSIEDYEDTSKTVSTYVAAGSTMSASVLENGGAAGSRGLQLTTSGNQFAFLNMPNNNLNPSGHRYLVMYIQANTSTTTLGLRPHMEGNDGGTLYNFTDAAVLCQGANNIVTQLTPQNGAVTLKQGGAWYQFDMQAIPSNLNLTNIWALALTAIAANTDTIVIDSIYTTNTSMAVTTAYPDPYVLEDYNDTQKNVDTYVAAGSNATASMTANGGQGGTRGLQLTVNGNQFAHLNMPNNTLNPGGHRYLVMYIQANTATTTLGVRPHMQGNDGGTLYNFTDAAVSCKVGDSASTTLTPVNSAITLKQGGAWYQFDMQAIPSNLDLTSIYALTVTLIADSTDNVVIDHIYTTNGTLDGAPMVPDPYVLEDYSDTQKNFDTYVANSSTMSGSISDTTGEFGTRALTFSASGNQFAHLNMPNNTLNPGGHRYLVMFIRSNTSTTTLGVRPHMQGNDGNGNIYSFTDAAVLCKGVNRVVTSLTPQNSAITLKEGGAWYQFDMQAIPGSLDLTNIWALTVTAIVATTDTIVIDQIYTTNTSMTVSPSYSDPYVVEDFENGQKTATDYVLESDMTTSMSATGGESGSRGLQLTSTGNKFAHLVLPNESLNPAGHRYLMMYIKSDTSTTTFNLRPHMRGNDGTGTQYTFTSIGVPCKAGDGDAVTLSPVNNAITLKQGGAWYQFDMGAMPEQLDFTYVWALTATVIAASSDNVVIDRIYTTNTPMSASAPTYASDRIVEDYSDNQKSATDYVVDSNMPYSIIPTGGESGSRALQVTSIGNGYIHLRMPNGNLNSAGHRYLMVYIKSDTSTTTLNLRPHMDGNLDGTYAFTDLAVLCKDGNNVVTKIRPNNSVITLKEGGAWYQFDMTAIPSNLNLSSVHALTATLIGASGDNVVIDQIYTTNTAMSYTGGEATAATMLEDYNNATDVSTKVNLDDHSMAGFELTNEGVDGTKALKFTSGGNSYAYLKIPGNNLNPSNHRYLMITIKAGSGTSSISIKPHTDGNLDGNYAFTEDTIYCKDAENNIFKLTASNKLMPLKQGTYIYQFDMYNAPDHLNLNSIYALAINTITAGSDTFVIDNIYTTNDGFGIVDAGGKIPNTDVFTPEVLDSKVIQFKTFTASVASGTTYEKLLNSIMDQPDYYSVVVDKNGNEIDYDDIIRTGMIFQIRFNDENQFIVERYTIEVAGDNGSGTGGSSSGLRGDTNQDNKVTITDMLAVKAHILGKKLLTGKALVLGDTNSDGKITITDFIQIKAHILGKNKLF